MTNTLLFIRQRQEYIRITVSKSSKKRAFVVEYAQIYVTVLIMLNIHFLHV